MKKLTAFFLAIALWPALACAQAIGIISGQTPTIGFTTGHCVGIASNGAATDVACSTGSSVSSISGGTTGLTPASPTTGAITLGGTLGVANGGTGVGTSTGSGSVVLSTSPTLITPIVGIASGTSLALGGATIGTDALGVTGTVTISGNETLGASAARFWSGRSQVTSPADGNILLQNNAGTGFTRLQLGGTTGSFPSIFRVGGNIQISAADGSGWAGVSAANFQVRPDTAVSPGGSLAMVVAFGSNGGAIYTGSGAPTISVGQGSIYLRTDGAPYFNVAGSTGYVPLTHTTVNTQTGATYSVVDTDTDIVANAAGTMTVTLPAAATYKNRCLSFLTIANQTVVSASSNVVPITGGAAGTAMLSGTAGKWNRVCSNATNWQIMAAN
jgi:hypothetical protein